MYKSKLQEYCHKNSWDLPLYTTVKDGADHCPRFTTTVTVNGVPFQSPQKESKSSKESQNIAAMLAIDYFNSSPNSSGHTPPSPSVPNPSPLSASSNKFPWATATNESNDTLPCHKDDSKNKGMAKTEDDSKNKGMAKGEDDSKNKDLLHLYKNRLQHYVQKNNLPLPEYSSEFHGPPHARRFRASVIIDRKTYQSSEYYPTLKDAEHAAAKNALDSLSVLETQEDDGLYKTFLQELAQKEGFQFPSYKTVRSGPSHMPTFVSSVEVGGEIYEGGECKTKKQSEMNAAKVAYNKLIEGGERKTKKESEMNAAKVAYNKEGTVVSNYSPESTSRKNVETSVNLQPINSDNCQHIGVKITQGNPMKRAADEESIFSPGSHAQPKHVVKENLDSGEGDEKNAKRYRLSFPEASPPCELSNVPSSCSMPSELVKSDEARPAEGSNPQGSKILILRRGSTLEIPKGASILPYYDDNWVAVRMDLNQDQQA